MNQSASLVDHGRLLVSLAKSLDAGSGSLAGCLRDICESAAQALSVDRVSVWLFGEDHQAMVCRHLYDAGSTPRHGGGGSIRRTDFPRYFEALENEHVIRAVDAAIDPATSEFAPEYLPAFGVVSMVDAPVRTSGEMVGVVCHESRSRREWTTEESAFAASVGDLIAQAISAERQRRLQEDLLHSQRLDVVGQLSSGLAHDLNNVLAPIRGYAELNLLRGGLNDRLQEDLRNILRAVDRGQEIVQRILKFGRTGRQGDHARLGPSVVDITAAARESVLLMRSGWPQQVALIEDLAEDLHIIGHATDVQQIILNLCLNAADAIGDHPGVVILKVSSLEPSLQHPKERYPDGVVRISVEDDGPGVPPDVAERIFQPFYTTKPEGSGTGLGLAMCDRLVKEMQGELSLHSAEGHGAIFHVDFPRSQSIQAAALAPLDEHSGAPPRILVVDDEVAIVEMMTQYFTEAGYPIQGCTDPLGALEALEAGDGHFDVLIVDQNMPGCSGLTVAHRAKAAHAETLVVLISGKAVDQEDPMAWAIDIFLGKPISLRDLEARLRTALGRRARGAGH